MYELWLRDLAQCHPSRYHDASFIVEILVARREHLNIVIDAARRRETERYLHTKRSVLSYVQKCSDLRYPTRFSLNAYMYSICGRAHAKRAQAGGKWPSSASFLLPFPHIVHCGHDISILSYFEQRLRQQARLLPKLLRALITTSGCLKSSSSQGS